MHLPIKGQRLISTSDYRDTPEDGYPFFLFDPEDGGLMFFRTAEIRDAIAEQAISEYCTQNDGWSEEVSRVCVGEVSHVTQMTNVETRPVREDFDTDEAFEEAEEEWNGGDFDETCTFELKPREGGTADYVSRLPADWRVDSSLKTWFPITAEELERARAQVDTLAAALRYARSNLRHAEHCHSNKPMVPPQGFNRYACDCGCDAARNLATDALAGLQRETPA
jgi:hypothetical protein